MDRTVKTNPHQLSDAPSIVAISLVHLGAEHRLCMTSFNADDGQSRFRQPSMKPLAERSGLNANSAVSPARLR